MFRLLFYLLLFASVVYGQENSKELKEYVQALQSTDDKVKINAIEQIGKIGPAAVSAIPHLLEIVKQDNEFSTKSLIGKALVQIDLNRSLSGLTSLLESSDWKIRQSTLQVLSAIATKAHSVIPVMRKVIQDENWQIRINCVWFLGQTQSISGLPILIKALDDKNDNVRVRTLQALGKMGPKALITVDKLIELLKDRNKRVCAFAAYAIQEIGPAAISATPELIRILKTEEHSFTLYMANKALVAMGPDAIYVLLDSLEKDKDTLKEVTKQLVIKHPLLVPLLISELSLRKTDIQQQLAAILGGVGKVAVNDLIKALTNKDDAVRKNIIVALTTMGEEAKEALPVLVKIILEDKEDIRSEAVDAIIEIDVEKGVLLLIKDLKEQDSQKQKIILEALGIIGSLANSATNTVQELADGKGENAELAEEVLEKIKEDEGWEDDWEDGGDEDSEEDMEDEEDWE